MKTICLLLLLTQFAFGQDPANKPDVVNRGVFEYLQKQDISTSELRDLVISEMEKIRDNTSDAALKQSCQDYIESAKKSKVIEAVPVDLQKAPKELLKKFNVSSDKFTDQTFVSHKKNTHERLQLTMRITKNKAMLVLKTYYNGKDWLFIEHVTFLIDGETYNYFLKEPTRDVQMGGVTEIGINFVNDDIKLMLEKALQSDKPVDVRFDGSKGNLDFVISKGDLQRLNESLELYRSIQL